MDAMEDEAANNEYQVDETDVNDIDAQNNDDGPELGDKEKLMLAERAGEIYRQQLKYMQDHLSSLRSLIQDKENIIENLMLRYDLGIINQDDKKTSSMASDEIEATELRQKAEALAQRTILENFELREMVNELRDENFHLRNEIYELQDKINRQALQIGKLSKTQNKDNTNKDTNDNDEKNDKDTNKDEKNEDGNDNTSKDKKVNTDGDDGAGNNDEANETSKRKHRKQESSVGPPPGLFGDPVSSDDDIAISAEAIKKRAERAIKHHRRESSVPVPMLWQDDEEDADDYDDYDEYGGYVMDVNVNLANKTSNGKPNLENKTSLANKKGNRHRRESSSIPVVALGFEDPDVLLHFEKLKNQDLEEQIQRLQKQIQELEQKNERLDKNEKTQIKPEVQIDSKTQDSKENTKDGKDSKDSKISQENATANKELVELIQKLKGENFDFRNEMMVLQDQLNRQFRRIEKMEKNRDKLGGGHDDDDDEDDDHGSSGKKPRRAFENVNFELLNKQFAYLESEIGSGENTKLANKNILKMICKHELLINEIKTQKSIIESDYNEIMPKLIAFETEKSKNLTAIKMKYENEITLFEQAWLKWDINDTVVWFEYILLKEKNEQENNGSGSGNGKNESNSSDESDCSESETDSDASHSQTYTSEEEEEDNNEDDDRKKDGKNTNINKALDLDFSKVESKLKSYKFRSKIYFPTVDRRTIQKFGFKKKEDAQFVLRSVRKLVKKYPKKSKKKSKKSTKS